MTNANEKQTSKIIPQTRATVASVCVLLSYLLLPVAARAASPTEQVRATVDKVLTIVRSPNPKSKAEIDAQRAQLLDVISPRFDFTEMAKLSLGSHWAQCTQEEQREFVKVFAALMERAYADDIESYTGQNVLYARESTDQNYAQVDTKIVGDNQPPLTINYKLHSVDKEWKVYDLVIEDISVVNNYRSQFDRVLARSSFAELVRTMKEKQPLNAVKRGGCSSYNLGRKNPLAMIHLLYPTKDIGITLEDPRQFHFREERSIFFLNCSVLARTLAE
jgi:phospholipid transport system substrate-binding protein